MGSELCANGLEMEGTASSNFIHNCVFPNADSPKVEEKNVRRFPESPNLTLDQRLTSIGRTVTPDSDRPSAERILDMPSQMMLVSTPPSVRCFDLNDNGSQTPKESIFDPFAPVHDKFMLAPSRRKCMEESRNNIVRRLSFSSTTNSVIRNQEARDDKISEEEQMFDIVYNDLLDVITSERTNEFNLLPNPRPRFWIQMDFAPLNLQYALPESVKHVLELQRSPAVSTETLTRTYAESWNFSCCSLRDLRKLHGV